jgi:hypothetical protein
MARRIVPRLFVVGTERPASKFQTVLELTLAVAARNRNVADAQSRALFDAQSVRTLVTMNAR